MTENEQPEKIERGKWEERVKEKDLTQRTRRAEHRVHREESESRGKWKIEEGKWKRGRWAGNEPARSGAEICIFPPDRCYDLHCLAEI